LSNIRILEYESSITRILLALFELSQIIINVMFFGVLFFSESVCTLIRWK